MSKVCSKCGVEYENPQANFHKKKAAKDGLKSACKACRKEEAAVRYKKPEVAKRAAQRRTDPEFKKRQHDYDITRGKDPERIKKQKSYNQKCATQPGYLEKRRAAVTSEKYKKVRRIKTAFKRKHDVQYRLSRNLRGRLRMALLLTFKNGHAVRDLGCAIPELKTYLESLFSTGMTWENWGKGQGKWNIDHIMPLSVFDLTDRQHVLLACHYLNLQPLWETDNILKSDKITISYQS